MGVRVGTWGRSAPPLAGCVAKAVAAEAAGYDTITFWDQTNGATPASLKPGLVGEEHSRDGDVYFDSAPVITAAAAAAERIGFVYGVIDVVRRPPHVIAQTLLTLDHATRGRVKAIVATGEVKQMRPYGLARSGAHAKLMDTVPIVRRFLDTTEPVSYDGRTWTLDRARVALPPYGGRPPPLWVAGGGPDVLELAGRFANGWFTYAPGATRDDPELFSRQVEAVRAAARDAKRDPDEIEIGMLAVTACCDDRGALAELPDHPIVRWNTMLAVPSSDVFTEWGFEHPFGPGWSYTASLVPMWFDRAEALDVVRRTPRAAVERALFVGTPEEILERLRPYVDAGLDEVLVINYADIAGVDTAAAMERLRAGLADA